MRSNLVLSPALRARCARFLLVLLVLLAALASGACVPKSRMVREEKLLDPGAPLGLSTADPDGLAIDVRHVIVRNGPGTWARDADWDEYVLDLSNAGPTAVRVDGIGLHTEGLDPESPTVSRAELEGGTRANLRILKGTGVIVGVGLVAPVMLVGASGGGAGLTGAALAAEAVLLIIPVALIVGSVYVIGGAVHDSKDKKLIDAELAHRGLVLPLELAPGRSVRVSAFFPVSPAPTRLVAQAMREDSASELAVDLGPLSKLHIAPPREESQRMKNYRAWTPHRSTLKTKKPSTR